MVESHKKLRPVAAPIAAPIADVPLSLVQRYKYIYENTEKAKKHYKKKNITITKLKKKKDVRMIK